MKKEKLTKKCPRCNMLLNIGAPSCPDCGLNFAKFANATNAEAKRAMRKGEKERVLNTSQRPSDVSKTKLLLSCIFGGLFGVHEFMLGRWLRGLFYCITTMLAFVLAWLQMYDFTSVAFEYITEIVYLVWVVILVIWIDSIFKIIFNKYKIPVSLPYED
ncbi:MAG: TM2 domain-containing protein [Clostridia bacterium]